jgi:flagellar assembly protein FliH
MKPLSTDASMRAPVVTAAGPAADAARSVRFDRPLVENPGWADPELSRQVAQAARQARGQALAEGYAAGWTQGRRAAAEREQQEVAERNEREEATRRQLVGRAQTLLAALAQTARTLAEQAVPAWDELTAVLVDGALAIAGAGLGRELAAVDAEALEAVRTALRLLPDAEVLVVRMHPDDADLIGDAGAGPGPTVAGATPPTGPRVQRDPTVARGTVIARTALQSLPLDLRAGLRAAEEVLRS